VVTLRVKEYPQAAMGKARVNSEKKFAASGEPDPYQVVLKQGGHVLFSLTQE
jgi:hypothetical protein